MALKSALIIISLCRDERRGENEAKEGLMIPLFRVSRCVVMMTKKVDKNYVYKVVFITFQIFTYSIFTQNSRS